MGSLLLWLLKQDEKPIPAKAGGKITSWTLSEQAFLPPIIVLLGLQLLPLAGL